MKHEKVSSYVFCDKNMNINIKATNIELTPAIKSYVEDKVSSFEKLISNDVENAQVWVEVGKTTKHHHTGDFFRTEIQIDLHSGGNGARVEVIKGDLYMAIDEAQEEMKRELRREKEKKVSFVRQGARKLKRLITRSNLGQE